MFQNLRAFQLRSRVTSFFALLRNNAGSIFSNLYSALVKLPWIAAVIVIAVILYQGLTQYTTIIEPISVPRTLSDRGYTPDVAGRRLRDAVERFIVSANSRMNHPDLALHGELPNIVVPTVGISLDAVVSSLRTLFRITRSRSITGEFTIDQDRLWLRLRLDNREFYSTKEGGDPERPDELFKAAVVEILKIVKPYFVASELTDRDPDAAFAMTKDIIAQRPGSDDNVAWAYVLQGSILSDRKEYRLAVEAAKAALQLNNRHVVAYNNLGDALHALGQEDEAIAALREAIRLDPKYSMPHNNLGNSLYAKGQYDDAIGEYREAIRLDPKYAVAHYNLGILLNMKRQDDEAIDSFREAIRLDPKSSEAHNNLGFLLHAKGKDDEAISEFREAIRLDPKNTLAHGNLTNLLEKAHKPADVPVERDGRSGRE